MFASFCTSAIVVVTSFSAVAATQEPVVKEAPAPNAEAFWSDFDRESARIMQADSLFRCSSWAGPTFEASQDYPASPPAAEAWPWLAVRVEADPEAYLRKVLAYLLEGNEEVDWRVRDNAVRKWFHAPWMTFNRNGREPIRGLTKERSSEVGELDPKQSTRVRNWAVAVYNAPGGYTLGRVWRDPRKPNTWRVEFPVGTVAAKLLFTEADPEKCDLVNSPHALVWKAAVKGRAPDKKEADVFACLAEAQDVRLLQLDLAVRDDRTPSHAGWVFGTFYFDAAQPGTKWHEKLVPAGVMWGNDPDLTHAAYEAGERPKNGWVNPVAHARFGPSRKCGEMGLRGRVNGPVDNPLSSCLSCHSRAMDVLPSGKSIAQLLENPKLLAKPPAFQVEPAWLGLADGKGCDVDDAKAAAGEASVRRFFRDLGSTEAFEAGFPSLDYSLQLADGVANFYAWALEFEKTWDGGLASGPASRPAMPEAFAFSRYCLKGFDCVTSFGRGDECLHPAPDSRPVLESRPGR
jgi:hypothetical protein